MSQNEVDNRSIKHIVSSKAMLGYVPNSFRIAGDERNHPCIWTLHPHLESITFSDGTTVTVDMTATANKSVAESLVGPVPDAFMKMPEPEPTKADAYFSTNHELVPGLHDILYGRAGNDHPLNSYAERPTPDEPSADR